MQLIRPGVDMLDPIKQKPIGPAEVMEKFGVTPDKMVEVQALIGDVDRQRTGRSGHRAEGRGATDQRIRRCRGGAGRCAGDEAVEAARHADRARRQGARFPGNWCCCVPTRRCRCRWKRWWQREPDRPVLAAWLGKQGFRSTIARLGLDGAGARRRREAAEAGDTPIGLAPPPDSVGFGPYESVVTAEAPARLGRRGGRLRLGRDGYRDRRAGRDARRGWWGCRWRSRRGAPATCRWGMRCWASR